MPDTTGLEKFRNQKAKEIEDRALGVIERLYRMNEIVSFSAVAKTARVSRNFLYTNSATAERIHRYRDESIVRNGKKLTVFSKASKNAGVKLRQISARYKTVLSENRALKKEIDSLRSYIDRLSHADN